MQYRIIITANNKKKKILQKSNDLNTIKKKYFKIKDKNKVLYPKQTSAYLKTKPVKYEIILMKKWGKNDIPFVDRDILGRTIEVKDTTKKWTILHKDEYYYEETFTVFGQDKRLNCIEIIKLIIMKKHQTVVIKQVPTPVANNAPRLMNPRYGPTIIAPNPAIVVSDVRSIALPVLFNTSGVLPRPSIR